MRRLALVAVPIVALALPAAAHSHAEFVRSIPSDGAVLTKPPPQVRLVFDDPVRASGGIRAVRNGGGSVLGGSPRVVSGGRTLVVPLRQGLRDGNYTVLWRAVSDDGHTLEGVIAFAVGAGRAPPEPSLSADTEVSPTDVLSRWLFLGGILVAAGGALFRVVVGAGRVAVLVPAFVAVFLGGSTLLAHQGFLGNRFGIAVGVSTLVAAVGATAGAISRLEPVAAPAAWACAALLLPVPALAGHALDGGRPRIEALVDVLHLSAAAAWAGGLVQLAILLRRSDADRERIRRFSLLALAAVVGIGATGTARAFAELDSFGQLTSTGYGRLLLVKTALLLIAVVVAWIGRKRGALRLTVPVELVLAAGLVVAVAGLTAARPGVDRSEPPAAARPPVLPPQAAFVDARQDGTRALAVAVARSRVQVTLIAPDGTGVDGADVAVEGSAAASCGSGCYEAPVRSSATIRVAVDGRTFTLAVPQKTTSAAALVARATRRFTSLRSVSYVERLASRPGNALVSDFTLEAPDRFSYRIHRGPAAIVIGARRWDRVAGGPWDRTPQTPLPQPTPIWEGRVTNAHVLSQTPRDVVVTFLNRRGTAWFRVRFDRKTLLPRELTMTAPAHFMHHRYAGFDAPRRIFPPAG